MAEHQYTWLVTWNKNGYEWEDYEENCEETKAGHAQKLSWTCTSTKPAIGDEVFLIKLGDHPRGMIGHGTVVHESYEAEHYNPQRARQGDVARYIGIEFDCLLDYEKDRILSQEELNNNCSAQHWSPQNSGISIKDEVLPTLHKLWKEVTEGDNNDGFWPSPEEYPVNLTKDDWKLFIQEVEAPDHRGCMRVLACFVDIGGTASPKTLSDKYKGHPSVYTGSVLNTSKRALKYFSMEPCPDGDTQRLFPIAFLGRVGKDVNPGAYEYKMRPELLEALKEMDLSGINLIYNKEGEGEMTNTKFDHNMILYGPPGTGKTYNSVNYAVAICENKAVEEVMNEPYQDVLQRYREYQASGRIAFTTFHQSYGYEEFIEGIRPVMADGDSEGNLNYVIRDGIFKQLCKEAMGIIPSEKNETKQLIRKHRTWLVSLDNSDSFQLKDRCFENDEIRFIVPGEGSWIVDEANRMNEHDLVLSYSGEKYIVDGIGLIADSESTFDRTGDNIQVVRHVNWLDTNTRIDLREFLYGERVFQKFWVIEIKNTGPLDVLEYIEDDKNEENEATGKSPMILPYVIIIDEINRGNISKIFGELITLIEETKRGGASEALEAILPYSGESFSVPDNVYIIGTMNTADRSIALMDTALRRRFKFVEMMPDTKILDDLRIGTIKVNNEELNISKMLDIINERIEYLFDREHTIGHAFFTRLKDDPSIDTLADIFEKNIIPLLQEYFYEDYEKIQLVLGDNSKDEEFKFILDRNIKLKDIFNGNPDIDLPEKAYSVQHSAFMKLESYKQIGKGL